MDPFKMAVVKKGFYEVEFYSKQRCVDGDEVTYRARCCKTRTLKDVTVKNMQVIKVRD